MPPRGKGWRQSLGIASVEAPADDGGRSHVSAYLAETYKDRTLNSRLVAQAAHAAVSDDPSAGSSTQRLARCRVTQTRRTNAGERPDNRNTSRGVTRAMRATRTVVLPEPYEFDCPLWDEINCEPITEKVSMLLPHELSETQIEQGHEHEWVSCDDSQSEFRDDIVSWSERTSFSLDGMHVAGGALWGDAAPYTLRDSIYLLIMTILTGVHRVYWWIACIPKRRICQCGCYGRCTFDRLFEVLAWSHRCFLTKRYPSKMHNLDEFPHWVPSLEKQKQIDPCEFCFDPEVWGL